MSESIKSPTYISRERSNAFRSLKELESLPEGGPRSSEIKLTFPVSNSKVAGVSESSIQKVQPFKTKEEEYEVVWNGGDVYLRQENGGSVKDIEVFNDSTFMGLCAVWGL